MLCAWRRRWGPSASSRARTNTACWRYVDPELVPAMQSLGLGLLPYFPLAGGMLTGKYDLHAALPEGTRFAQWPRALTERFFAEPNPTMYAALLAFCRERRRSLPEQLKQNVEAAGWTLSAK